MVEKKSDTTVEMVEKPQKNMIKLKTFVIQPGNITIEAFTEKEAVEIFKKTKKPKK